MNIAPRIVSGHLFLARAGTAFTLPAPGTVGREAKPGSTDTAWVGPGIITDLEIVPEFERKEIMAPVPGRKVRYDLKTISHKLTARWTCQELSPLAIELVMGAQPLSGASTQFNPLAATSPQFWAKFQCYDETDALVLAFDLFGTLMAPDALQFGDDFAKPRMELAGLHSTLNTGTI